MRKTILILTIAVLLRGAGASQVHADTTTLTVQGSTASFSGIITTASNQFIQPAFGPVVLKYKSGLDTYTDGIVMRPGDGNVGIGMTAGTNIPSKLTVAGTVELTSGSIKFPDATSQTTAATTAPAGAVIFWDGGTSCPAGWAELTAARGFTIVGLPASGTLAGTVGTALTNLEDRTHTHTGPSHTHTYTDVVAHTHAVDPPATTSTTESVTHTHAVDPPITTTSTDGAHTHTLDVNLSTTTGTAKIYRAVASVTRNLTTNGAHTVSVDIASFTSGSESTTHTHSVDVASFTSGSTGIATGTTAASGTGATGTAATSNVIPYIQLLVCTKT